MIKTGIYGSALVDDPVRKQLLRLLLRHPDVDLRAVASTAGNAVPLAELHPVFAGETALTLEREIALDDLDVLFVIDEENLNTEFLEKLQADEDFHLIVLGHLPVLLEERPAEFVYGLPEYYRKPLVRGARAAVVPRPEALLIELAFLPLAKRAHIEAPVHVTVATPAPMRLAEAVHEAARELSVINVSPVEINFDLAEEAPFERLDLVGTVQTPLAIEEIERIYLEAYEDHSFVHLLPSHTRIDEDLRGSNKCLLQLSKDGDVLTVNASMDALTKGTTGNAVHIMDLLFGLHERTGLSI